MAVSILQHQICLPPFNLMLVCGPGLSTPPSEILIRHKDWLSREIPPMLVCDVRELPPKGVPLGGRTHELSQSGRGALFDATCDHTADQGTGRRSWNKTVRTQCLRGPTYRGWQRSSSIR